MRGGEFEAFAASSFQNKHGLEDSRPVQSSLGELCAVSLWRKVKWVIQGIVTIRVMDTGAAKWRLVILVTEKRAR